jgi:hypothetical protein
MSAQSLLHALLKLQGLLVFGRVHTVADADSSGDRGPSHALIHSHARPAKANRSGGTPTVTDGTNIALLSNYMASMFVASSDGHGGTSVVDSTLTSLGREISALR